MKNQNPIGLFDSGIGGTSIWKEVNALMPFENTIYIADSKNAPYGLKSKEEIIALSCKNTEFLLNNNCKISETNKKESMRVAKLMAVSQTLKKTETGS